MVNLLDFVAHENAVRQFIIIYEAGFFGNRVFKKILSVKCKNIISLHHLCSGFNNSNYFNTNELRTLDTLHTVKLNQFLLIHINFSNRIIF